MSTVALAALYNRLATSELLATGGLPRKGSVERAEHGSGCTLHCPRLRTSS